MLADDVTTWFTSAARDLPWRRAGTSPYAVLVSEVMLQQTPVSRVVPVYETWLDRWPTARALATADTGDVLRVWGRLGYPRRALRLQAACAVVAERYDGELPLTVTELLALPGVGDYTARAVAAFAHRQRHAVVDTNVRRVVARAVEGVADAPVTKKDLALVEALLPRGDEAAAVASAAFMELGALVCTARAPRCASCPLSASCVWLANGAPALAAPVRKAQAWAGTDRQVRGRLMAVLRDSPEPVAAALLDQVWDEPVQRTRALDSLVADGLVDPLPDGRYCLPVGRADSPEPSAASSARTTSTRSTRASLRR